jgi:hypothetical protein
MRETTIFAICLGLTSLYPDTAESMRRGRTSQKEERKTSSEPQVALKLEIPGSFVLANWIEENQKALVENEHAITILQAYMGEILLTIDYVNSEYVNNVIQAIDKIIRGLSRKDQKFTQLKKLRNDLAELLRLKKSIRRALKAEKRKFDHPFLDKNDPLVKGVLYMFKYIDTDKLKDVAGSCEKILPHITDKTNKREIRQTLQELKDLLEKIETISEQAVALEKTIEGDSDILDEKFPRLQNLSKTVAKAN